MIPELARAARAVTWQGLGAEGQAKLKLCLLANIAVAVAGTPYVKLPKPTGGGHFLFGGGGAATGREAAFYNAAAMHARTQDDFHPVGNLHLGTVVIPAALAAAERNPCGGARLLEAIAAGYMTGVALSRVGSPITTPKGFRSTGYYAPFGAAVAVARILDLDQAQTASALAITASLASGLTQCWADGSDEWQLHVACAAENGLRACDLARAGVAGGMGALDGPAGLFNAIAGRGITYAEVAPDLESPRAILETVMKRYPVSGICQPLVMLTERMVARDRIRADEIEGAHIEMNPFEMRYAGSLNKGPFHSFSDVIMSAAFCCGAVLTRGILDFGDLLELSHPVRDRLIAATRITDDPDLPLMSSRLHLTRRDGTVLSGEIRDAGQLVSVGWADIDPWGAALFGDARAYERCRTLVGALESRAASDLMAALRG